MSDVIKRHPFSMVLLLMTNRCNLSCRHCYVQSRPGGAFGFPYRRLQGLIGEIGESLGAVNISISGGEPLARPRDAMALLGLASATHPVTLLTNGTLISDRIATMLSELDIRIRISLDGGSAEVHDAIRGKGSFAKTIGGIERLQKQGFPIERLELFAMLPPENVQSLAQILELAESLKVKKLKVEPVAKTGRALDFWPDYTSCVDADTQTYRENIANQQVIGRWHIKEIVDDNFSALNIYSDGGVYPYTYQDNVEKSTGIIGNVYTESLRSILDQPRLSRSIVDKYIRMTRVSSRSLAARHFIFKD